MPLITCPDCNNQISDAASSCPHCGRPLKSQKTQKQHIVVEQKKRTSPLLVGCLAFLGVVLLIAYFSRSKTDTTKGSALPEPNKSKTQSGVSVSSKPVDLGKWKSQTQTNSVDDSTTVVLALDADSQITGWLGTATPSLVLRCQQKKTEAYIDVGVSPHVESGNLDGATITLRFDKNKAVKVNCSKSTDGHGLFLPRPIEKIKTMLNHESMYLQFVPHNASPTSTTFTLKGLDKAIQPLRKECNW